MLKLKGKQQEVLYLPANGHGVICGVAGSGKSVCATVRAKYIEKLTDGNVLILTFNNALINYMKDINADLNNEKIIITTYHKFAIQCMRSIGILGNDQILQYKDDLINNALKNIQKKYPFVAVLKRDVSFFYDEIQWMQRFGILDEYEYNEVERIGRKNARLLKNDRKYVFMVYKEYCRLRRLKGKKYDWDDCAYYLNKHLSNKNIPREYECIIIDEGQDFSPMMIKSIVSYMNEEGSILYLGDNGQKIYGKGSLSWRQLGLRIRKVHTLDENHRNTKQIARLANSVRSKLGLDIEDGLSSMNSLSEGLKPRVVSFDSKIKEEEYIINEVKKYIDRESICIITTNDDRDRFKYLLNINRVPYTFINKYTEGVDRERGIFISNFHSAKGLEFDNVIIPSCSQEIFNKRVENLESEDEIKEIQQDLGKIIYVGITRAKENLTITYCGELLSIIPKDRTVCNFYKGE